MFDPLKGKQVGGQNRGLMHWSDGLDQRVYYGVGYYLYSLDRKTGVPVKEFGNEGRIDLRQGLDRQNLQFA